MKKNLFVFALILLFTCSLWAQVKVTGKVTNSTGEPIPGVNVIIKGTEQGTITDTEGDYALTGLSSDAVLVFSFIGMLTEEVTVDNQTEINMVLVEDIMSLDEVVVIGYGTVKRRDLTGAVSSVKAEDIIKTPTLNAMEAIQGRVTGVDIIRNTGRAGSDVTIKVRGNRSFGDPNRPETFDDLNRPLFIIDGIQGGSFSDLNTNDIESIEVLKDASTTAIYGWQGANGVIIITTKKAKAGKTKVSYNGYYGVNGLTPYPEGRFGDDYLQLRREANRGTLWNSPDDDQALFPHPDEWQAFREGKWINWTDYILDNGKLQSHQLSVSGGNEKSSTYFSVGYYDEQGPIKDAYKRYTARLNSESNFAKWAKAGLQAQVTYINNDSKVDALSKANAMSPLGTVYNEDGSLNLYPIAGDNSVINPLTDTRENAAINNNISSKIFTSGYLEITPFNGLSLKTVLGANINFSRRGIFNDSLSMSQYSDNYSIASINATNSRNINWDNIITYTKELSGHSFTVTGITSYTEGISDYLYALGSGQENKGLYNSFLFYNIESSDITTRTIESQYTGTKTMSYAGRLNYSYKGKYLLTLTERLDGNSRLSPGHQWSWFPSIAMAWRISDENFARNIGFLTDLKLRLSYGEAGIASIEPYGTISGIQPGTKPQSFGEKVVPTYFFKVNKANENLEWERSASYNLGLDFAVLDNRAVVVIDLYSTKTTGILMARSLPMSLGGDIESPFLIWQNIGSSQNKGIEISLNTLNVRTASFKWTSSVTFSRNNEKIVSLIDGTDIISGSSPEDRSLLLGKPIGSYYNYQKLGIWQLDETEAMAAMKTPVQAGEIKVADLNNDSIIDANNDRTYIGSKSPKWVCGFQNTFTYKDFDLSVYLFARWGQMIKNELLSRYNPAGTGNGPAYLDYWTPENPTNDFPQPRNQRLIDYSYYQTLPYVDGSFFKLKNISLGYTLPRAISTKLKIEKMRVYCTASNLFTVAKSHLIKYYDPENSGSEKTPMSRQIIFGVNLDL
ncbi:MAG: TonB-dependent receptor [Bacteroidales bacterium]|nr:TonB-dependent receptor [Bacteroidales bacterium]